MKEKYLLLAFALLVLPFCGPAFSQDKDPDHQKMISIAHFLEEKPLDPQAKEMRSWAFVWASDTKDLTIVICGLGSPFFDKKAKFGDELLAQYAIGMAAFKLEHPDKASDENAAQLAGIESSLKVYDVLVKDKPKGKTGAVDALIVKRDKGELAAYVAQGDCGKK